MVFLGCLQICGGPLGFMQGVAWVGMTISYSSDGGFVEGVKKTFDGDHPCRLCCAIQKEMEHQEKLPLKRISDGDVKIGKLAKDMCCSAVIVMPGAIRHELFSAEDKASLVRFGQPAGLPSIPPPKQA